MLLRRSDSRTSAWRTSAFSPNVASDLPLPVTRRRLARRSKSANGTPPAGPLALTKTRPSSNANSSGLRFSNGDPGVVVAIVSSDAIALSAAAKTAGTTDPVAIEPPETGPSGSDVSPSATSTLSSGTPVFSEASCARIVYVPVPMSCVPHATRVVPSSRSCTLASAAKSRGDPRGPSHSPAERQSIAFHRADLRVALRPAELFRAKLEALEKMT